MLGNDFVVMTWQVPFATHEIVKQELAAALEYGPLFGINPRPSPDPTELLQEGDTVSFGETKLEVFFTPGHSPGHISFFHRESAAAVFGRCFVYGKYWTGGLTGWIDGRIDGFYHQQTPTPWRWGYGLSRPWTYNYSR